MATDDEVGFEEEAEGAEEEMAEGDAELDDDLVDAQD